MNRRTVENAARELQSLYGRMLVSEKNEKGVLIFSRSLSKEYHDWYKVHRGLAVEYDLKAIDARLPNKLPTIHKHFELLVAISAFCCPFVVATICYWIQLGVFVSTLIAISTTTLLFLFYFESTAVVLRRQQNALRAIGYLVRMLKKGN